MAAVPVSRLPDYHPVRRFANHFITCSLARWPEQFRLARQIFANVLGWDTLGLLEERLAPRNGPPRKGRSHGYASHDDAACGSPSDPAGPFPVAPSPLRF